MAERPGVGAHDEADDRGSGTTFYHMVCAVFPAAVAIEELALDVHEFAHASLIEGWGRGNNTASSGSAASAWAVAAAKKQPPSRTGLCCTGTELPRITPVAASLALLPARFGSEAPIGGEEGEESNEEDMLRGTIQVLATTPTPPMLFMLSASTTSALCAALGAASTAPILPVVPLLLCGGGLFPLTLAKTVLCSVAGCMFAGALNVALKAQDQDPAECQAHQLACVSLLVSCSLQAFLACGQTAHLAHFASSMLGMPLPHFDIAFRFLEDLVTNPLLIVNLGYLAGVGPARLQKCIGASVLATTFGAGASLAVLPEHQFSCLILETAFTYCAAQTLIHDLPAAAWELSHANFYRVKISGDLVGTCWALYPLVQTVGLITGMPVASQLCIFVLLDVPAKFGPCHILLKSHLALKEAANVANGNPRAAAG